MSYCLNPACTNPNNPNQNTHCQACGSQLLLRDRYRSSRILGRGGFATTFLAIDESLPGEPTCVIKQLRPVLTAEHILEMSRELFQREAATLGKIGNHPQLPRLLDYFELKNDFYLVQEYVSGATLQQEVRRSGAFDEARVTQVLLEVLPLLDYLHQQKVIHRDIKPANVIQRSLDNKYVLIDFGAVKDQVSQTAMLSSNPDEAFTTFAVGTPGFAPPEQMAMRPVYASDIYSLGVTCLYLLTGKSPKDLNYNPTTGELDWQNLVNISPAFEQVLTTMMATSLRDRYQSAKHVLQALEKLNQPAEYSSPLSTPYPTIPSSPSLSPQRTPPPLTSPRSQVGSRQESTAARRKQPSPTSRIASRIRAQNQRLGNPLDESMESLSQRHSRTGSFTAGQARSDSTSARSKQAKVTPKGLLHAYSRGSRDFSGCDLKDLDLRKVIIPSINFHEAKLQGVNFKGAELHKVNFGRATLTNAKFTNANLSEAYLSYADLEGADMRGANLIDAHLTNANLRGANFCGANLTGASVSMAQLAFAQVNWLTVMPNGKRGRKGRR